MVKISVQSFTYLTRVKPSLRQKTNTPIDDQMATRSLTLDFAKTTVMNWSTLSVPASLMKYILFTTRKYKIHSKNTLSELAEPSYLHLKETSHLLDQYIFISSKNLLTSIEGRKYMSGKRTCSLAMVLELLLWLRRRLSEILNRARASEPVFVCFCTIKTVKHFLDSHLLLIKFRGTGQSKDNWHGECFYFIILLHFFLQAVINED